MTILGADDAVVVPRAVESNERRGMLRLSSVSHSRFIGIFVEIRTGFPNRRAARSLFELAGLLLALLVRAPRAPGCNVSFT